MWGRLIVGIRRHGTTGEAPLSRFAVEHAVLRPLLEAALMTVQTDFLPYKQKAGDHPA